MKRIVHACAFAMLLSGCAGQARHVPTAVEAPPAELDRLMTAADHIARTSERSPDLAWHRLTDLVDLYGARITGSHALAAAIDWAAAQMRADGLDAVRLQPVEVPHWVRGKERARIVQPVDRPLAILALGGSVGTHGTLRAPLVVFASLDELRASDAGLDNTIALVNHRMRPFDEEHDDPGYREGVQARLHAASEASKRGAVAVLVRSVTAVSLGTPHAGALSYDDGVRKIPAVAVSTEDSDLLDRLAQRGAVQVELSLGAQTLKDAPSANVIGELRGRELPDEIVLLAAHIDSWDVGPGASDDAAGCIAIMEALRLLRAGGMTPRRTIRAVLFTGEEYGLSGSQAYKKRYGEEHHVAAFETDYGMAAPDAIGAGSEARAAAMAPLLPAFATFGIHRFKPHAYGTDVAPIVATGVPAFDLEPVGRHYFDIHHSAADTLDKIRPEDLRNNAGAIALLAFFLGEQ